MKREFKFRAWSSESEKMMPWGFISTVRNIHKLLVLDHITVMQYTGLKDKNRVEIYEGDLLTFDGKNHYQVLFGQYIYDALFYLADKKGNKYFLRGHEKMTVAGNIYEHPNLLQS